MSCLGAWRQLDSFCSFFAHPCSINCVDDQRDQIHIDKSSTFNFKNFKYIRPGFCLSGDVGSFSRVF